MAALDLDYDPLGPAAVVVKEVDVPVHPGVGAAPFVVGRPGVRQAQGLPFELVAVLLSQGCHAGGVDGLADDLAGRRSSPKLSRGRWRMRVIAKWVTSMPIQRRLSRSAATVAVPQKGSRTTSPALLLALMMRSRGPPAFVWGSRGVLSTTSHKAYVGPVGCQRCA